MPLEWRGNGLRSLYKEGQRVRGYLTKTYAGDGVLFSACSNAMYK